MFVVGLVSVGVSVGDGRPKPIYGADDRTELFDVDDDYAELKGVARSVAAIVPASSLIEGPDGFKMSLEPLGRPPHCADPAFPGQPHGGICTSFLIAQDLIATAAHCVKGDPGAEGLACEDLRVVFDYQLLGPGESVPLIDKDQIYRCEAVEGGFYHRGTSDWRIVQLDRPILARDRQPLQISTNPDLSPQTPVATVGFPLGLPMKAATNASVLRSFPFGGFNADLDTFVGNSGSPVMTNSDCGLIVVGLLSSGANDHASARTEDGCSHIRLCSDNSCVGEHVTSSSEIANYAERPFDACPVSPPVE